MIIFVPVENIKSLMTHIDSISAHTVVAELTTLYKLVCVTQRSVHRTTALSYPQGFVYENMQMRLHVIIWPAHNNMTFLSKSEMLGSWQRFASHSERCVHWTWNMYFVTNCIKRMRESRDPRICAGSHSTPSISWGWISGPLPSCLHLWSLIWRSGAWPIKPGAGTIYCAPSVTIGGACIHLSEPSFAVCGHCLSHSLFKWDVFRILLLTHTHSHTKTSREIKFHKSRGRRYVPFRAKSPGQKYG